MPDFNKIYLYRMIHIKNIPHVLKYGMTHSSSPDANPNFVPIGDSRLISTRGNYQLQNGRKLGDYIPFYFGVRMPMLYVIKNGYNFVNHTPASDIVYCVTSVNNIITQKLEFVFTDGHAVDSLSSQYNQNNVQDIDSLIDKKAISAKYWKDDNDLDLKRRKEAEFLVLGDISINAVLGYIVNNQAAKDSLMGMGVAERVVYVKPDYYF